MKICELCTRMILTYRSVSCRSHRASRFNLLCTVIFRLSATYQHRIRPPGWTTMLVQFLLLVIRFFSQYHVQTFDCLITLNTLTCSVDVASLHVFSRTEFHPRSNTYLLPCSVSVDVAIETTYQREKNAFSAYFSSPTAQRSSNTMACFILHHLFAAMPFTMAVLHDLLQMTTLCNANKRSATAKRSAA